MHEWALAEAVISSVVKFSKENKFEIKEIKVSLGELQQIDMEVFNFALKEMMKSMGLDFEIIFKKEKALLKCMSCKEEWTFNSENLKEEEKELPQSDASKIPDSGG